MSELSKLTALYYDYGNFVPVAQRLAETFGTNYWFTPWKDGGATRCYKLAIGSGLPRINRVKNLWYAVMDAGIDLYCFFDVGDGDLQTYLRHQGKRVWGSGRAEELELYRPEFKELLEKLGLAVQPYDVIYGMEPLREHLQTVKGNKWIKVDCICRGDSETFGHKRWLLTKPILDELEYRLGPLAETYRFVVEDEIKSEIEIGYDGFCIDGQFPKTGTMMGYEIKDSGLIGVVKDYAKLPKAVRLINEKLAPVLKKCEHRGFFSTEIRITKDGTPYFIDPTMRAASPPSALYSTMWENLAECVWEGAGGKVVDPKPRAKYGAELILKSNWATKDWLSLKIPNEAREWVRFKNFCRVKDNPWVVPNFANMTEIGSAIGIGGTVKEAVEAAKAHADMVDGIELKCDDSALEKAMEEVEHGESKGIKF